GRLYALKGIDAIGLDGERPPDDRSLTGTADGEADDEPAFAQPVQLGQHSLVLEYPALQCCRMDLVEVEKIAEQRAALGDLPRKGRQRMVLDLMDFRIELPIADIGVAPLGSHLDVGRRAPAMRKPRRQEPPGE